MANDERPADKKKSVTIVVNGTPEVWTDEKITYEQVVQLAFPGGPTDSLYTVAFASPRGRDGTLAPGQVTEVKDGTVFTVGKTNRS